MNKKILRIIIFIYSIFILAVPVYATFDFDTYEKENNDDSLFKYREIGEEIITYLEYYAKETFTYIFNIPKSDRNLTIEMLRGTGQVKSAAFLEEIYKVTKDMGEYSDTNTLDIYPDNKTLEVRAISQFENGNITVNISFDKKIPYFSLMYVNGMDSIYISFDKTNSLGLMGKNMYDDYYIKKGINPKQVLGMKKFYRNFYISIFILIIIIIAINIYKSKNKKNILDKNIKGNGKKEYDENNLTDITENLKNDTELVALITAAIMSYTGVEKDKIHIKTVKKVKWNR